MAANVVAVLMATVPGTAVPTGKLKAAEADGEALEELEVTWSAARAARTAVTTDARNSGEGRDSETGEEAEETAGEAETKALSRLLRVWRGMGEAARTQSKAMQSGRRRKKGKSLAMLRDPQLHVDDTASAPASEQGAPRGNRWPAGLGVNFA